MKKSSGYTLYLGYTYFFDADRIHSSNLTCISPDLDEVHTYLAKIRGLQIIDPDSQFIELGDTNGACASITAAHFQTETAMNNFINDPSRSPYVMSIYHTSIDRHIRGMSKKDVKDTALPEIVQDIIDNEVDSFKTSLTQASHTLAELLYYINGVDSMKMEADADSRAIIKVCSMIRDFVNNGGYGVEKGINKRHPILFCSEHEYRNMVHIQLEHRKIYERYRLAIDMPYT